MGNERYVEMKWYDEILVGAKYAHALMIALCLSVSVSFWFEGQVAAGFGYFWVLVIYGDNVRLYNQLKATKPINTVIERLK